MANIDDAPWEEFVAGFPPELQAAIDRYVNAEDLWPSECVVCARCGVVEEHQSPPPVWFADAYCRACQLRTWEDHRGRGFRR